MSKKLEFYTIALCRDGRVTDYPVELFLQQLREQIFDADNKVREGVDVNREINDKWIRIFPFYSNRKKDVFVVPFGKYKKSDKPYWINDKDVLEEIPGDLFDVTSIAYESNYRVLIKTVSKQGPSAQVIEAYLNSFIPESMGLSIRIEPIMHNTGIEKVRNAELVRSVTLTLDLWQPLHNFYASEIARNKECTLLEALALFTNLAKDEGNSRTLSLTLGLGKHGKKEDTLNIDVMLQLLEQINLNADFVKEITVNYKNGRTEKMDSASLKQSEVMVTYTCYSVGNQVTPFELVGRVDEAISHRTYEITSHVSKRFEKILNYRGEMLLIEKQQNKG